MKDGDGRQTVPVVGTIARFQPSRADVKTRGGNNDASIVVVTAELVLVAAAAAIVAVPMS